MTSPSLRGIALASWKRDGSLIMARDDDQKFGLRDLLAVEKPSIAEVLVTVAASAAAVPVVLGFLALGVAMRAIREVIRALSSLRVTLFPHSRTLLNAPKP